MNWLDYVVLVILAGGAIHGLRQGLVRQMISLVAFSAGFVIAGQHYHDLTPFLGFVGDPRWQEIIAFAIITFAVMAAGSVAGQVLHRFVGLMMFGCFDQVLGAAFGVFMYALLIEFALVVLANFTALNIQQSDSILVRNLAELAPVFRNLFPQDFESFRQSLR